MIISFLRVFEKIFFSMAVSQNVFLLWRYNSKKRKALYAGFLHKGRIKFRGTTFVSHFVTAAHKQQLSPQRGSDGNPYAASSVNHSDSQWYDHFHCLIVFCSAYSGFRLRSYLPFALSKTAFQPVDGSLCRMPSTYSSSSQPVFYIAIGDNVSV